MMHWCHENWAIGWFRMPLLSDNHPLTKLYICYDQYYVSGFWKRLWLRVKIRYYIRCYRRLMKNETGLD